ncbi:MAG: DUF2288 domain-containing protein [Halioglobus sp.]|nr:DUF2288 domain-containing protein [Halioglobus sp.]
MVDADREALLRREYHGQTARIHWHDLQTHYARGSVVRIAETLNLVEVAVQLGLDNTALFQDWIDSGDIAAVDDEQALAWYASNEELWAVVAAPWVLVQLPREGGTSE